MDNTRNQSNDETMGETNGKENKVKNVDEKFSQNYRMVYLSLAGLVGLIAGFLFLSYSEVIPEKGKVKKSSFHEIGYHPRAIFSQAVQHLQDSIAKKSTAEKSALDSLSLITVSDPEKIKLNETQTLSLKTKIKNDSLNNDILENFRQYYDETNTSDSLSFVKLNKALHFDIDSRKLDAWETQFDKEKGGYKWRDNVRFWLKIPDTKPMISYSGTHSFSIEQQDSNVQFTIKYPGFGTWVILIGIFCSYCCIAILSCINLRNQAADFIHQKGFEQPSWKGYVLSWLLTLAAIAILVFIWQVSFNDEEILKCIFFMKHFQDSIRCIIILGYLAGSACLAGFIYIASLSGTFAKDVTRNASKIKKYKSEISNPTEGIDQAAGVRELESKQKKEATSYEIYIKLQDFFNQYFVLSAIILSILVFCTGAVFTAINSLDFLKLLADDWGYSPIRPDYILMYGAINTLILMLVYIPAKIWFNEIRVVQPKDNPFVPDATGGERTGTGTGSTRSLPDIFKNPLNQIKEILVVASPLLASLVQALFSFLFN